METAKVISIRIEEFRSTDFFRGDSSLQRILIMSYSWGLITYILLALFYSALSLLFSSPIHGFEYYFFMGLGFLICSPLFGLLMSILTENRSLLNGFRKRAIELVSSGVIDLSDSTLEFWSPAMLTIPFKGSFSCILRVTRQQILIDYFSGIKFELKSIALDRIVNIEPHRSKNPFVAILFRPNLSFKIGKIVVRCLGLNDFLVKKSNLTSRST